MLSSRFAPCFSRNSRLRGESYFHDGRVGGLRQLASEVTAEVTGEFLYKTKFSWSGDSNRILVTCSCLHFADGNFCKHLWATLLAIESQKENTTFPVHLRKAFLVHGQGGKPPVTVPGERPRYTGWQDKLERIARESLESDENGRQQDATPLSTQTEIWYRLELSQPVQPCAEIRFHQRTMTKDGSFGALKPLSLTERQITQLPASDKNLLSLLVGSRPADPYFNLVSTKASFSGSNISVLQQDELLERLCQTGRFGWSKESGSQVRLIRKLEWDKGAPWELELHFEEVPERGWKLRGYLSRQKTKLEVERAIAFMRTGLVVFDDEIARFSNPELIPWIQQLRGAEGLFIQARDLDAFVAILPKLEAIPKMHCPRSFPWKFVTSEPVPKVRFRSGPAGYSVQQMTGELTFVYGANEGVPKNKVLHLRDFPAEKRAYDQLVSLRVPFLSRYEGENSTFRISPKRFVGLARELLGMGWLVESERGSVRVMSEMKIEVSSGIDWFDLKLREEAGGKELAVPALLQAIKRGETFVTLGDGSQGLLPEEWLEKFSQIANLGVMQNGTLRFRSSQAVILNALLEAQSTAVDRDKHFAKIVTQLESHRKITAKKEPAGFKGKLRDYQRRGLGWLQYLEKVGLNGCLADDMGLGKTVQVLAHLQAHPAKLPTLIVAPKSLVFNWLSEAAKFTASLKVIEYTGGNRKDVLEKFAESDLVVTTYGAVRSDILELSKHQFHYVILDESHSIKNSSSLISKAVKLLQSKYRLVLTGTPIENHIGELWSQFEFLNPGMLGSESAFKQISQGPNSETALQALSNSLQPFILRRTKEQVLKELPAKTEQILYCDFEESERKKYDELREHFRSSLQERVGKFGVERSQIQILEGMLRLRQAACDFALLDKEFSLDTAGTKIRMLLEQLEEVLSSGHKALIFSQFTSFLGIVRAHLDKASIAYEYLDGATTDRKERVQRFQEDKNCGLFLLSLKAGGVGLNLTAADYVFVLDPWWNPAAEAQAIDRAHRIGQKHPVMVYRLIVRGTIEEKVMELQKKKKALTQSVLSNEKSILRAITQADLQQLFSL